MFRLSSIDHLESASALLNTAPRATMTSKVVCREIMPEDFQAVALLLSKGFPTRDVEYWQKGLRTMQLGATSAPEAPYGYVLVSDDRLVGVLLTIHGFGGGDHPYRRCNLSSWYIEPEYRSGAMAMERAATKDPSITYSSISPAPYTRKLMSTLGHKSLNEDALLAFGLLMPTRWSTRVESYLPSKHDDLLGREQSRLCADHSRLGCDIAIVLAADGALPFILRKRAIGALKFGCAEIVYTPGDASLEAFAGPLARFLLRRGIALWKLEARTNLNRIPALRFAGKAPRLTKGYGQSRANDLAYSELVVFGP